MDEIMSCPICGTENKRAYSTECMGIVENHYFCSNCGYFDEMAYSPRYTGICLPDGMSKEKWIQKYGETNLRIYLPEEAEFI